MTATLKHTGCIGSGCPICVKLAQPGYAAARAYLTRTPSAPRSGLTAPPNAGPGAELKTMLAGFGVPTCGECSMKANQMDGWGVAGCQARRAELIDWLRGQAAKLSWAQWFGVAAKAAAAGAWFNPLDPAPGLVDEAIRRADATYRKLAETTVQFIANDHIGLGDRLLLLAVAEGYKRLHPEKTVYVDAGHHWQWLELFDSSCVVLGHTVPGVPTNRALDGKYRHWHQYDGRNPWECCAEQAGRGVKAVLPPPRPLDSDPTYAGCIALVPFAAYEIRCWPLMHWLTLERLLLAAGYRVVILDDRAERCQRFTSPALINRPAGEVAAVLRACACVVSNDSGLQHVAGMLSVPTIVLAAVFKGFTDLYPNTRVLSGGLACDWCHQDYPKGGLTRQEIGCAGGACQSLRAVSPERVLQEVRQVVPTPPRDSWDERIDAVTADPVLRGHLRRYTPSGGDAHPRSDRRPTTLAFMEHLRTRPAPLVVETGCQREANDYGAGMSSTVYGLLLAELGGRLVSLELSEERAAFAADATSGLPVEVVQTDSRTWLAAYQGPPIDGLYLDSADVGQPGYTDCCLEEAQAALPHLAPDAPILIDDTWRDGDGWAGKGTLAVPWLLAHGWEVAVSGYQVLLRRAT